MKQPTGTKCCVVQTESAMRVQTKERSVWTGYQKSIRGDFMEEVRALLLGWIVERMEVYEGVSLGCRTARKHKAAVNHTGLKLKAYMRMVLNQYGPVCGET